MLECLLLTKDGTLVEWKLPNWRATFQDPEGVVNINIQLKKEKYIIFSQFF
jgi:hypothetical protein